MHGEDQAREIDLREYLRTLWRRKWVIVLTLLVVAGVSIGLAMRQDPVYSASAQVLVSPSAAVAVVDPNNADLRDRPRTMQNEIEFTRSDALRKAVLKKLGSTPEVAVTAADNADVLTFSVSGSSADRTATFANIYAETYINLRTDRQIDDYLNTITVLQGRIDDLRAQRAELVAPLDALDARLADTAPGSLADQLQIQRTNIDDSISSQRTELDSAIQALESNKRSLQVSTQLSQTAGAQLTSKAEVPSKPTSPNVRRSATTGIVLGLLVGVALAFLFERIDDSVKSKLALERASGTHALGLIPVASRKQRADGTIISLTDPNSPAAEAYRTLRTSLQFVDLNEELRTILVTSANAGEGKTTTVANLAVAFARADINVIAVGVDLRRPRLHDFFGVSNERGFTSVLLGDVDLDDALQEVPGLPRLRVLTSGPMPPNPSELLASRHARSLLASLEDRATVVLLDSPPVLPVTDALVLSSECDGIVMVAFAGSTSKKQVARAIELLGRSDAPVVGSVLNGVSAGDGYGYGYGYGYSATAVDRVAGRNGRGRGPRRPPTSVRSVDALVDEHG